MLDFCMALGGPGGPPVRHSLFPEKSRATTASARLVWWTFVLAELLSLCAVEMIPIKPFALPQSFASALFHPHQRCLFFLFFTCMQACMAFLLPFSPPFPSACLFSFSTGVERSFFLNFSLFVHDTWCSAEALSFFRQKIGGGGSESVR
ncbi:hypothetical protein EJ08DRAFT_201994 [Tothia fuscella]|uniref:Uncharacterized protein n=1 Tax=Tothia fuscella TaxID=1048955 RepID=A0A9P4TXZ9_9PEZI|nr:hypothetical protein EJ08DRAFT_201994 [Tothia fuscella]